MRAKFYRDCSLFDLVTWSQFLHQETNWLFVILDSNPDVWDLRTFLSPRMQAQGVSFWWRPEGLWLAGRELHNSIVKEEILVPFTACYIFNVGIRECSKPDFAITTDFGSEFTKAQIDRAERVISKLGALGFAADGCGLQYVCLDDVADSIEKARVEVTGAGGGDK